MRLLMAMLFCLLLIGASPSQPATLSLPTGERLAQGSLLPEVRLRKMHLVRPDLIPYPISYEVYC